MDTEYITVLSGLAGALLGALASTLGVLVNERLETRRQLTKLAYEAMKDWQGAVDLAAKGSPRAVIPLMSYVYFRANYMRLMSKNKLTKENLVKLNEDMDTLWPQKRRDSAPAPRPEQ